MFWTLLTYRVRRIQHRTLDESQLLQRRCAEAHSGVLGERQQRTGLLQPLSRSLRQSVAGPIYLNQGRWLSYREVG
jgi:hypothetical protein